MCVGYNGVIPNFHSQKSGTKERNIVIKNPLLLLLECFSTQKHIVLRLNSYKEWKSTLLHLESTKEKPSKISNIIHLELVNLKCVTYTQPIFKYNSFDTISLHFTEKNWYERIWTVLWITLRIILFLGLLYIFICSLSFLSSAFRLLGGAAAGTCMGRGAGKARFNVATLTYATVTCTVYVLLYNLQTKSI